MEASTCVVAGALGVAGRALIEHLESTGGWNVIALARRGPDFDTRARFVSVDLLDGGDCRRKLAGIPEVTEVTHVFFAAYSPQPTLADEVRPNLAMLVNLVTTLEAASPSLRHVAIVQGSKWYGNHLGPYKTPAREDDPRHMPPNFYYDQQDWLASRQSGKRWTWSALRPHGLCGVSVGSAMNQLMALAVYAGISRELGLPLRFPGREEAFRAVYQFTDARLLARALTWAASTPACANEAFNITNGDVERWENLWPSLAACFDMPAGRVQTISLSRFMADKEPLWSRICRKYDLKPYTLTQLVNWDFADWVYANPYDQISSLAKARQAGWHETLTAEAMFVDLIGRLRAERLVP